MILSKFSGTLTSDNGIDVFISAQQATAGAQLCLFGCGVCMWLFEYRGEMSKICARNAKEE